MTQAIKIREVPYRAKIIKVYDDGSSSFSGLKFHGETEEISVNLAMNMIDTLLSLRIINNLRRNSDQQNELST